MSSMWKQIKWLNAGNPVAAFNEVLKVTCLRGWITGHIDEALGAELE